MAKGRKPKGPKKDQAEKSRQQSEPASAGGVAALRKRARWRSMLVPGAGFWELGLVGQGWAAYGVAIATVTCCLAFTLFACQPTFWAAVVSLAAYVLVSTIEYAAIGRAVPRMDRTPPPRHFRLALMTLLIGSAVVLLALIRYDGRFVMHGSAMAPTVREGDWLFFSRFVPTWDLKRGTAVAFALEEGGVRDAAIARVIALPGDQIARQGGRYVINGRTSPFAAATMLGQTPSVAVPYHPQSIEVPEGHYFLSMDESTQGVDSQALGWMPAERIISSRMLLFRWQSWAKSIHRPWEP